MSENPFQALCQTFDIISKSLQTHLSQFIGINQRQSPSSHQPQLLVAVSSSSKPSSLSNPTNVDPTLIKPIDAHKKKSVAAPVTKEELGRATWTFLHTLAAQYPDSPTRQQKKDVKELVAILSRMYPCKECADHFKEVVRWILKLNFRDGFVMCTTLLTEALINQDFRVSELMQDGASLTASSVLVIYKEIPTFLAI